MSAELIFSFYGDDFTGSTDALEVLARAGLKTALFIAPPSPAQVARYGTLQALGIAGMTRAMAPEEMENELRPAFSALRSLGAAHVHYKVCSTFDSSPTIGSIGRAIDAGADIFGVTPGNISGAPRFVPLVVGAPPLGRYCVFGNLFARMGIGSEGGIHRLDRHPSMSRHPVTPADESDLRLHLAKQTSKRIALFDILQVTRPEADGRAMLEKLLQGDKAAGGAPDIVLFDALYTEHLARIGALIDPFASRRHPLFSAGSSGIEMALCARWAAEGKIKPVKDWPDPGKSDPLLVISGSCSPITGRQIAAAVSHGFAEVALDTPALAGDRDATRTLYDAMSAVGGHLKAGRSIILHTSLGDHDNRLQATADVFARRHLDRATVRTLTAEIFGGALGKVARAALEQVPVKRLVIAGGDTSSYAARALGIESVEMVAPLTPGAPICRAHALGSPADGVEVIFKGGQVGGENYFELAARGRLAP